MTAAAERRGLRHSLYAAAALAVVAILWGWAAGSQVILLDGIYATTGILLSWLSLRVSAIAEAGPTPRFPFGREALVPVVVAAQGLTLLATLLWAAVEAIRVILEGGSEVATGALLAYGALSGVAALAMWWYCGRVDPASDLLRAESRQWGAGAVFSGVVVAGSLVGAGLHAAAELGVDRYVDSALVLVGCLLLVPQPVALVRGGLTELLEGAAPPDVQQVVTAAMADVRARFGLPEPTLMTSKVGRKLYVEAVFVVPDGVWDVAGEDRVRHAVQDALTGLPFDLWASVELTTDPALA